MSAFTSTSSELKHLLEQPYLSSDKLMTLIRRYKLAKDPEKKHELREQIFNNNVRFIRKQVLRKVKNNPDKVEDTFNAAVIFFFEGLEKFKPHKRFKFQTYIAYWIDRAIYDEYVAGNIVNVSRGDYFKKDSNAVMLAKNSSLTYLDAPVRGEDGGESMTQMDIIFRRLSSVFPENEDHIVDKMGIVNRAIGEMLTNREYSVLYLKYIAQPDLTFDEVGEALGVSRERIRHVLFRAFSKIRYYVKTRGSGESYQHRYAQSKIPELTIHELNALHAKIVAIRKPKNTGKSRSKKM